MKARPTKHPAAKGEKKEPIERGDPKNKSQSGVTMWVYGSIPLHPVFLYFG
jgi:hypothetical protein